MGPRAVWAALNPEEASFRDQVLSCVQATCHPGKAPHGCCPLGSKHPILPAGPKLCGFRETEELTGLPGGCLGAGLPLSPCILCWPVTVSLYSPAHIAVKSFRLSVEAPESRTAGLSVRREGEAGSLALGHVVPPGPLEPRALGAVVDDDSAGRSTGRGSRRLLAGSSNQEVWDIMSRALGQRGLLGPQPPV